MHGLQSLLDATVDKNCTNQLQLATVRKSLGEYFEERLAELASFPSEAASSHWNLMAADWDTAHDAHFLAAYFCDDSATFLAGRGPVQGVRDFGDSSFPDDAASVLGELERRFSTSARWTTTVAEVVAWTDQ